MEILTLKNIKSLNKICGIYKIKINDKIYIGSALNIRHRLKTHLTTLKNQTHHNRTMQNLFNKYGENLIYFELIEECDKDVRITQEKYYIDSLKPYINHILDPVTLERDEIYKQRISEAKKKYYETHDPVNIKSVYQYDLNGTFLSEFKSVTEAANTVKQEPSAVCACCNGRGYTSGGFRWSYDKLDKLPEEKKNYKTVAVLQCDLNDNVIKTWESKTEAEKELNICNISRAIREGKTAGGFKWRKL